MIIAKILRRFLALLIRVLMLNRVVTIGLLAVLVVAVVGVPLLSSAAGLGGQPGSSAISGTGQRAQTTTGLPISTSSTTQPPDPTVETFIKGTTTFDANLRWSSLHPQARTQLETNGVTLDSFKAEDAAMRAAGVTFEQVVYVGGYTGPTGYRYYFYILTHRGLAGPNALSETYFAFTIAPDGGGIANLNKG